MGKRGPKPTGPYGDKTKVLSTRITAPTRAALERAAAKSKRSLSSEIEYRLRRSFDEDQKIEEIFFSREIYAFVRLVAEAMNMAGLAALGFRPAKERRLPFPLWLGDPYA